MSDTIDNLALAVASTWPLFAVGLGFLLLLLGGLCFPDLGKRTLPEANPFMAPWDDRAPGELDGER